MLRRPIAIKSADDYDRTPTHPAPHAHSGAAPDDWAVILDGKEIIGRIYRAPNRQGDPWFWGLTRFPSSAANSCYAPSLDEAKARFKARWEAVDGKC